MQSIATQYESPDFKASSRRAKSSNNKRDAVYRQPLFYDFIDLEDPIDLEKLKSWCKLNWAATFRKAFLHRNVMNYHSCCNSFSKRTFSRGSGHPADHTFDLHRVPAFRSIETEDDLYRWVVATTKENRRQGQKTLFPTVNLRHVDQDEIMDIRRDYSETESMLRKRCHELEQEIDSQKLLLKHLQDENCRLLWSSKAWHSKYEELLDQREPPLDLYATPVKQCISNSFSFLQNT